MIATPLRTAFGLVGALAIAAGPLGCAQPYPLYEGPPRSESELSFFDATEPCKVLSIDGRRVPHLENWFALEPGSHWIWFRVRRPFRDQQASTNCLAYVDMQPGHTYVVRSRFERELHDHRSDVLFESSVTLLVELENANTGERLEDLVCE